MQYKITVTAQPELLTPNYNKAYIDWFRRCFYHLPTINKAYNVFDEIRKGTPYTVTVSTKPQTPPDGLVMQVEEVLEVWEQAQRAVEVEKAHARLMLLRGAAGDVQAAIIACKLMVEKPEMMGIYATAG